MSIRRKIALASGLLFAAIAVLVAANFSSIRGQAEVGAAYGAHVTCSCRFIQNRDLASCETDREAGMEMISFSEDADLKRLTARVPLLASATAEYRPDFGCVILSPDEVEAAE